MYINSELFLNLSFPVLGLLGTYIKKTFLQTPYNIMSKKAFLMNEMKGVAHKTFNFLLYFKLYLKNTGRKCVLLSILPWSPSETNIAWSYCNTGNIETNSTILHKNIFHFLCSTWNMIVLWMYKILYSQIEFV